MSLAEPIATPLDRGELYYFLQPRIWMACIAVAVLGMLSANPWVTAFGFLIPPLVFSLLWRTGETPTLLFIVTYQWLQAMIPVIVANCENETLDTRFGGPELETSAYLSLLGVLVLSIGMRLGTGLQAGSQFDKKEQALSLDLKRLLIFYFVCLAFAQCVPLIAARIAMLRQPLYALSSIKWIPVFLITYRVIQTKRDYNYLLIVIALEIVLGFAGFFSSFKDSLMLVLIVVVGADTYSAKLPWAKITGLAAFTFLLIAIWQGVKMDYREYMNKGTMTQTVQVEFGDRMVHLADLVANLDGERFANGILGGFDRIGYLFYFAHSIDQVPRVIEHQNGKIWLNSVQHVTMPRFLFPNKDSIDESQMTNKFTGLGVAGTESGTSISIGYMGECYIDFGPIMMFVPILILGLYYGLIYSWFVNRSGLYGMAVATALILFNAYMLETSTIKIVGGVTAELVVLGVLDLMFGMTVWKLLSLPPGYQDE